MVLKYQNFILEKYGVSQDIVDLAKSISEDIYSNEDYNSFIYDVTINKSSFKLEINISDRRTGKNEGLFAHSESTMDKCIIYVKSGDPSILAHEIKHAYYFILNNGKLDNMRKALMSTDLLSDGLRSSTKTWYQIANMLFYLGNKDEFEAQLHSMYFNAKRDITGLKQQGGVLDREVIKSFLKLDSSFNLYVGFADKKPQLKNLFKNEERMYLYFDKFFKYIENKFSTQYILSTYKPLYNLIRKVAVELSIPVISSSRKQILDKKIAKLQREIDILYPKYQKKLWKMYAGLCEEFL